MVQTNQSYSDFISLSNFVCWVEQKSFYQYLFMQMFHQRKTLTYHGHHEVHCTKFTWINSSDSCFHFFKCWSSKRVITPALRYQLMMKHRIRIAISKCDNLFLFWHLSTATLILLQSRTVCHNIIILCEPCALKVLPYDNLWSG